MPQAPVLAMRSRVRLACLWFHRGGGTDGREDGPKAVSQKDHCPPSRSVSRPIRGPAKGAFAERPGSPATPKVVSPMPVRDPGTQQEALRCRLAPLHYRGRSTLLHFPRCREWGEVARWGLLTGPMMGSGMPLGSQRPSTSGQMSPLREMVAVWLCGGWLGCRLLLPNPEPHDEQRR